MDERVPVSAIKEKAERLCRALDLWALTEGITAAEPTSASGTVSPISSIMFLVRVDQRRGATGIEQVFFSMAISQKP
jgi:hypothetical protein